MVNVFATVRDKDGHIVTNLTKEDFTLQEDGRPQVIRYFARQSDLPLTLGLLIDTSGSERRMLSTERQASYTFLEQVLRPEKDKAFLIRFDHDVELLQDLTSSRQRLEKALNLIDRPQFDNNDPNNGGGSNGGNGGGGQGGGQGRGRGRGAGGTAFYDAVYLASDEVMQPQSGRKALIMLTDGEDNASKIALEEAISSANRADTIAYAVRIADDEQPSLNRGFGGPGMGRHGGGGGWPGGGGGGGGWPGGGGRGGGMQQRPDGKKILKQIAKETGGTYFEVSKKKPVDEIYTSIEEELRNQYSIGYSSDNKSAGETNFRRIELTVDKKGLTVQSRSGYYPGRSNT